MTCTTKTPLFFPTTASLWLDSGNSKLIQLFGPLDQIAGKFYAAFTRKMCLTPHNSSSFHLDDIKILVLGIFVSRLAGVYCTDEASERRHMRRVWAVVYWI